MASLISEDLESVSYLSISAGRVQDLSGQKWQGFALTACSGGCELTLGIADPAEAAASVLCRQPKDEVARLIAHLEELIAGERERVLFEPAEPSFELELDRGKDGGFKVHAWLDAGNAKSGIYRWDAAGIRFFTTQAHLAAFVKQLKHEFAC